MKKIIYLIILFAVFSSCKFDDNPYSIIREFDSGTYITPDGKVKYISGTPDSLITVSDNYAVIQENITYVRKNETGILADSILIYGHVYSKQPNPVVCGYDSVSKIDLLARLAQNSNYYYVGSSQPESFITPDELDKGVTFQSGFGLHYETQYYSRSFVVTGKFVGGKPEYKDIAYNQNELEFTTDKPVDLWVGGTMQDAPADFTGGDMRGATSFTYDGYLFVAQGHNEAALQESIILYRYDPVTNSWTQAYITKYLTQAENFTDAVSFVLEGIKEQDGKLHDYLYLGIGYKQESSSINTEFYRLDLTDNTGGDISTWGSWVDMGEFDGLAVKDAIAFSLKKIGYVGLGTLENGTTVEFIYKFDPTDKDLFNPYGKWLKIGDFPPGTRTKAVCFKIGENVYVSCGMDNAGVYKNDLWRCNQITGDYLNWVNRAPFPGTPRIDAVGFALGENGYVGTGLDVDSVRSDFWRYNPFINQWDQRAFYGGEPRYEAVGEGVKINDNDYRGYIGTGWNGSTYFSDFWHYRP